MEHFPFNGICGALVSTSAQLHLQHEMELGHQHSGTWRHSFGLVLANTVTSHSDFNMMKFADRNHYGRVGSYF